MDFFFIWCKKICWITIAKKVFLKKSWKEILFLWEPCSERNFHNDFHGPVPHLKIRWKYLQRERHFFSPSLIKRVLVFIRFIAGDLEQLLLWVYWRNEMTWMFKQNEKRRYFIWGFGKIGLINGLDFNNNDQGDLVEGGVWYYN